MSLFSDISQFSAWAKRVVPTVKFDPKTIPTAPNYEKLEYWAAHPQKESKASFKPEGVVDDLPIDADVFYLHPTSYFGQHNWNYDFKNPQATELIEEVLMPLQASVFNSCCRIFAPKYRQATFYSFLWNSNKGRNALDVAYTDLKNAFEYYIQNENNGRPFFIASHSQGTCHGIRLLEEVIEHSNFADRMVAAYLIGFRIPEEKFTSGRFKKFKLSKTPTDFNSVIAWDTYLEKGKPSNFLDRAEVYYPNNKKWIRRANKKPIGTNPISWLNNNQVASKENNLGAISLVQKNPSIVNRDLFGTDEKMNLNTKGISAPMVNEVSAHVKEDGFLYISKPKNPVFYRIILPAGNMHNYDYDLFYMNIRKNIQDRLKAFLNK